MLGNLEPEEHVMDDSVMYPGGMLGQLAIALEKLGWEYGDDVDVEIGGTSVSGIDVGEEYNKKWQSPLGTRKYNKDAFIIIKNQSRRDLTKSQPFPEDEFKPAHPYVPVRSIADDIVVNMDGGVGGSWKVDSVPSLEENDGEVFSP